MLWPRTVLVAGLAALVAVAGGAGLAGVRDAAAGPGTGAATGASGATRPKAAGAKAGAKTGAPAAIVAARVAPPRAAPARTPPVTLGAFVDRSARSADESLAAFYRGVVRDVVGTHRPGLLIERAAPGVSDMALQGTVKRVVTTRTTRSTAVRVVLLLVLTRGEANAVLAAAEAEAAITTTRVDADEERTMRREALEAAANQAVDRLLPVLASAAARP